MRNVQVVRNPGILSYLLLGSVVYLYLLGMVPRTSAATNYVLLGWSEAGMYFVDTDYSVFAIHPPGSTLRAQIVQNIDGIQARLLTNASAAGITVTYEAVPDPDGSINRTSATKNNFWDYALPLFGTNLPPDAGLGGSSMPGFTNRLMAFSEDHNWFTAAGIPITPYDDDGKFNSYSLMRLKAWKNGVVQTNIDVVLPATDEMDCRLCHASSSNTAAAPVAGWAYDLNPDRDYRLNVLRLHDERQATNPVYAAALSANGYNSAGLYASVKVNGKPVLCAKCHFSTPIAGSGYGSIKPLTRAIHNHHAGVTDPRTGQTLSSSTNRTACYTCHGGALTHFLRGAMGNADSTSGQLTIQCQSCHGTMAMVGATNRVGWMSEPNCQACHVGDALTNVAGQIRYSNALTNGVLRTPANTRFASTPNTPSNGLSLFSYSSGHHGLMCSACHGSPHAEFPSSVRNDNIRSFQVQGHGGVIAECDVCHQAQNLNTVAGGGPHGTHPHNYEWADGKSAGGHLQFNTLANCGPCHGTGSSANKRGTILSQARGKRAFAALPIGGDVSFWQGQTVGCTHCHGASGTPTVTNTLTNTSSGVAVTFTLGSSTNNVRIVTQGGHGLVGLTNKTATYTPETGFYGTDTFTFASATANRESALGTGTVVVTEVFTVGDGIPNWWRQQYFGGDGKSTDSLSTATADPDGDGMSNSQEYGAKTDPRDPLSVLRLFAFQMATNNVRLGFSSTISRRYTIDRRDSLTSTNAWETTVSNVWGRTISTPATDSNSLPARQFYRIRVLP